MFTLYTKELKEVFGPSAAFREGQKEAIDNIVNNKRMVVVQKTGWGKSLIYFLSTKILRQHGKGVTLIISPLLSLTRNQIESTEQYGIIADSINASNNNTLLEKENTIHRCNNNECDVLFITPEQLQNSEFINLLSRLKIGLFVVDEAHCISDWGHDFRPDYRRINQFIHILPENIPILATTATANQRVIKDIQQQLGDCEVIRGDLYRKSLFLHKKYLPTAEEKYAWIAKNIPILNGSGIIYATTIRECERLASWLRYNGISAQAYHANLPNKDQVSLEQDLIDNKIKVLVSTIALGMGFDKKDLQFVIHYYTPKSVIEYYQQIGRAGRGINQAICILLYGDKQADTINMQFINNSFPNEQDMDSLLDYLSHHDEVKIGTLQQNLNIKETRLKQILKLLQIDGIISKDKKSQYTRTLKEFNYPKHYYNSIIELKKIEYNELIRFQNTSECLMRFITKALDNPNSGICGKCSSCLGVHWNYTIDVLTDKEITRVSHFFQNEFIQITPRKNSSITNKRLAFIHEGGLTLSYYHDILGQEARAGKYQNGKFSDRLVIASHEKIKKFMRNKGVNTSNLIIIPIPSNRRPYLVPEFAKRLAYTLQCSYQDILAKRENEPEQKSLLNSQHQEQSIRNHLYIKHQINLDNQHILLVDDFVDSKWTFTIAAELLGTEYNHIIITPYALANSGDSN